MINNLRHHLCGVTLKMHQGMHSVKLKLLRPNELVPNWQKNIYFLSPTYNLCLMISDVIPHFLAIGHQRMQGILYQQLPTHKLDNYWYHEKPTCLHDTAVRVIPYFCAVDRINKYELQHYTHPEYNKHVISALDSFPLATWLQIC